MGVLKRGNKLTDYHAVRTEGEQRVFCVQALKTKWCNVLYFSIMLTN